MAAKIKVFHTKGAYYTDYWGEKHPMYTVPLKRVDAETAATPDGRFSLHRVVYDDGSVRWYWQEGDEDVDEHYSKRWSAVSALGSWLLETGKGVLVVKDR